METFREKEAPPDVGVILRERRRKIVEELRRRGEEQGKVFFEGRFLTEEEVRERFRIMKRRDRVAFAELLLLFALLMSVPAALGLVLAVLCA